MNKKARYRTSSPESVSPPHDIEVNSTMLTKQNTKQEGEFYSHQTNRKQCHKKQCNPMSKNFTTISVVEASFCLATIFPLSHRQHLAQFLSALLQTFPKDR